MLLFLFLNLFLFPICTNALSCNPNVESGPSSSGPVHAKPILPGSCVKAIMSVGDGAGKKANGDPYRLTGLVDGLGVLPHPTDASKFYVFSNHEMFANQGATRDHGSNGAYVSHMTVDKKTLTVTNLTDLVPSAAYMHSVRDGWSFLPKSFARLCSANIPSITAIYNSKTGLGSRARLYMAGEEENDGRAMAFIVSGPNFGHVYTLPHLGRGRWENIVLNPYEQDLTIAVMSDDRHPAGILGFYIGTKQNVGNDAQKAGLNKGRFYAFSVVGQEGKVEDEPLSGRFQLVKISNDVDDEEFATLTGMQVQNLYLGNGGTMLLRPEDIAWHPRAPHRLIVVTTNPVKSRMYRLEFDDLTRPVSGGTIVSLLEPTTDVTSDQYVSGLDNIEIDGNGNVVICEDAGAGALNRVLLVEGAAGPPDPTGKMMVNSVKRKYAVKVLAVHNPDLFGDPIAQTPATLPYTTNNEFSGIVDASAVLGAGWYLMSNQAHNAGFEAQADSYELIERGQLLAVYVPPSALVPATPALTYPPLAIVNPSNPSSTSPEKTPANTGGVQWWHVVLILLALVCCCVLLVCFVKKCVSYDDEYDPYDSSGRDMEQHTALESGDSEREQRQAEEEEKRRRAKAEKEKAAREKARRDKAAADKAKQAAAAASAPPADDSDSGSTKDEPKVLLYKPPPEEKQSSEEKPTKTTEHKSERKSTRKSKKKEKKEDWQAYGESTREGSNTTSVDDVSAAAKAVVAATVACVKADGVKDKFVPAARSITSAVKSLTKLAGALADRSASPSNQALRDSASKVRKAVVEVVRQGKALMADQTDEEARSKLQNAGASVARYVKQLLGVLETVEILDE